jgi:O-antigen/teichoic acid export membrane protein
VSLGGQLRKLLAHSAVYGAADVLGSVVNFLLVPVYTAFLAPAQYGDLALLLLFATVAKIVFRLGLDAGFFRIHYTLGEAESQRRLAGSVLVFAAGAGALLFAATWLGAPVIARALLSDPAGERWIRLAAADVWVGTFAHVPLSLLRIQERPQLFSALSAGRHLVNALLKVALVAAGWGVTGVLLSDLLATGAFVLALLPVAVRHARPAFSRALLREALLFGLPKVPHGLLVQALNLADRKILDLFATRAEVGLYQLGYTFGTSVKFALSAFEPAWQPFVYAEAEKPGGPATLARIATYVFAAFLAVGLGVAVLGPDLLRLMADAAFHAAAPVVPVVALAYVLHGAFLLGSIGIGIARAARYYPMVTAAAAAANIGANLVLVPRFGMMGAAWSTVLAYAVMLALGFAVSRRLYPMPLEWGRLARLVLAAGATYGAAVLPGRGTLVRAAALGLYPLLLAASGFLREGERAALRRLAGRA